MEIQSCCKSGGNIDLRQYATHEMKGDFAHDEVQIFPGAVVPS